MSKQHNDRDNQSDLSNQQPYDNDLSQTIEFTEEEKQLLRRPNEQPVDGDYFTREEMPEVTEPVSKETASLEKEDASKGEAQSSIPVNEFRYKSKKEQKSVTEPKKKKKELKPKQRKKIFSSLFEPTFEEHYDLTELEDITDYNQFNQPKSVAKSDTAFKNIFSKKKNAELTEALSNEDEKTDVISTKDLEANQAEYKQLDSTSEKEALETEVIDKEIYPAESGIEASYEEEIEETDIMAQSEAEPQVVEETKDDVELVSLRDKKISHTQKIDISGQFKDKELTDEELEDLSTQISQDTTSLENPILTDQALNEYYGQEDLIFEDYDEEDETEEDVKASITSGASWLTIGNVLSRVIGALYVIPWATWLGNEYTQANVLFSAGYTPYSFFLAIATAGFPSSIAKQMAFYHSKKEYKTADKLFKNSLIVMLFTGVISAVLLFLIAPVLASGTATTNVEGATLVIRSLSPALLILPVMSLLRGYFQGFNDMKPTAISQILEQFARVGYLLAATYAIMMIYNGGVTTAVVHSTFAAFIGALLSLLYLVFEYIRRQPVIRRLLATSKDSIELNFKESTKIMVVDSIPFILLGSGIIIAQLIDQFTFGQILEATSSLLLTEISEMYGAISLDVNKLVMIIISLAVALASSVVPIITKSFAKRDIKGTSELVEHIVTLFCIVMIPAALGMAAIANNIYILFYPNGSELGPSLLVTASVSSIFLGAYTVLSTVLQSMNFRRLTVRFLLIGIIVKAVLQFPLVAVLEGHGALLSTGIAFLVSTILMWVKLNKELNFNYRKLNSSIIKILVASTLTTISAVMWNESLNLLFGPVGRGLTFLKIVIVIIMALLTYGSILGITNMLHVLIGDRYKDLQDKMRLM